MKTAGNIEPVLTKVRELVDAETAKVIDFIYTENCIWREIHGGQRSRFTESQRHRLVKAALPIKDRLNEFATLVKPETILRWYRRQKQKKWDHSSKRKKTGRPPKPEDTVRIVLRLADENGWGYDRIHGEMLKLGHEVSPSSIARILKENGYPTAPDRKGMSWKEFIKAHMDVSWAADMFTEEIVTLGSMVTVYVLFFIHLGTRRVHIAGVTPCPKSCWIQQQTRQFLWKVEPFDEDHKIGQPCKYLIHDRDSSFLPMDKVLRSAGIKPIRTPFMAPNANAFAERFVREARETLDNLIIFGEPQLRRVLKKIEKHHNEQRPHQGIDNAIPLGYDYPRKSAKPHEVKSSSDLGGLLRHYYVDEAA
jgi:hypothetical protein